MLPDTMQLNDSGTWFLSYLCSVGIIDNDDTVQDNCVIGTLVKDFCGIPAGHHVYIVMENPNVIKITYASPAVVDEIMYEDGDVWFDDEYVKQKRTQFKTAKVNITFTY